MTTLKVLLLLLLAAVSLNDDNCSQCYSISYTLFSKEWEKRMILLGKKNKWPYFLVPNGSIPQKIKLILPLQLFIYTDFQSIWHLNWRNFSLKYVVVCTRCIRTDVVAYFDSIRLEQLFFKRVCRPSKTRWYLYVRTLYFQKTIDTIIKGGEKSSLEVDTEW